MTAWYKTFFDGQFTDILAGRSGTPASRTEARLVKRLLFLRRGQRALDIPCGMGRLTVPLAKSGVFMTGIDLTADYIATARRLAAREQVDVRLICSDMRRIDFCNEFHAAFNWFGSFGYFSDADNLRFCQAVCRALKPGGRFLIDGMHKAWVLSHFRREHEELHDNGVRLVRRTRWHDRTQRVRSSWTFCRGHETEEHSLSMRLFNASDMRRLLRRAGFREFVFHGAERLGAPVSRLTRHSRRMIVVARKAKK